MKIGPRFTRFIKIVSIVTAFLMIFAIFYSIKSRMGQKRTIVPGEDPYMISNYFNSDWRNNSFWIDSVEKNYYTGSFSDSIHPTSFYLESKTSKELFNEEFKVKSSDKQRLDLVEVFQNQLISSRSFDNVEGSFMGILAINKKVFMEVFNYKQSSLTYEGILFRGFELNKKEGYRFYYNSYLDKEAIGERIINDTFIFEDQLFTILRSINYDNTKEFKAFVMESQMLSKLGRTHVYEAKFKVKVLPNLNLFQVEVGLSDDKINTYVFEKNFPNKLIKANLWNGLELNLMNTLVHKK